MSIIDNAKEIASLIKKYNDQDLYEKIVNLRDEIFNLREENLNLKEKIKTLEADLSREKEYQHDGMKYWQVDENGNAIKEKGAFCPTCLDNKNKVVRLLEESSGHYWCQPCQKSYGKWKEVDGTVQLIPENRRVRRRPSIW